jgi:multiple antibiotic resistance protein
MWENFLKSFIPLFFALDALGLIPLYSTAFLEMDRAKLKKVLRESIITAFLITLVFVAIGNKILIYLNVSISDLLVAGGVILFIITTKDLVGGGRNDLAGQEDLFAVVPLGVPLLAGPAVLTTSLIIFNSYGFFYVLVSLLLNLLFAGVLIKYSFTILRFISRRWVEAISKVFVLLLASIAVMFIRTGLQGMHLLR